MTVILTPPWWHPTQFLGSHPFSDTVAPKWFLWSPPQRIKLVDIQIYCHRNISWLEKGRLKQINLVCNSYFHKNILKKKTTIHIQVEWIDKSTQKGIFSLKKEQFLRSKIIIIIIIFLQNHNYIYALYWKIHVRKELTYLVLYKRGTLVVETESSQSYKNL